MAEKNELQQCVRCKFVTEKEDRYCIKCGAPLKNRCTREKTLLHKGCSKVNKPDAKFCADCGTATIFNEWGLL
ncbi:zinc ribbon domain-containing protein [Paenibacillus sp. GCM10023248]|uniref:double zinc ribbon domain-containing protein n=1 Tax=Bacillales TaxID=1385 RepID=UPI002379CFD9|nr:MULTISPECIES: zinc ribbon domain-containing protein [Bacillales]MDD9267761.1 zinc ribbon domain-containing protein [Paenibacillus sp. MAHUQ-63]MDR6882221.1 RNA polymerase subunit RPABC4/transcription elongation factor Spt4 [Bacillus sp. 3255]